MRTLAMRISTRKAANEVRDAKVEAIKLYNDAVDPVPMKIPFTKAHGARNDFLLTWRDQLPAGLSDMAGAAVAICDRYAGVGADGWLLISRSTGGTEDAAIELWNSDGSRSELSGND